jgi:hypothetical protein
MVAVPVSSAHINVDWLNEALNDTVLRGGNVIREFSIEPVGEDLGYLSFLYRIFPTYSEPDENLPRTLIVKFPSTEEGSRSTGNSLRAFERESLFYMHCSGESPCVPPAHYYSYSDVSADQYILVMEDLDGCRFVNQVDGVEPADAVKCMAAMAEHHALYWGKTDHMSWAPLFSEYGELYKPLLQTGCPLMKQNWPHVLTPTLFDHLDRANELYPLITEAMQSLPTTLIHCDPRIENIAFSGETPRFYDWQLVARGPAAYDVMYFLKQSMDRDIRRECEDELFKVYVDTLKAHGVDYSVAQLKDDIGLATCTIWAFTAMIGNFFFPGEVNEEIASVTMPRWSSMIEDFGGMDRLAEFQ